MLVFVSTPLWAGEIIYSDTLQKHYPVEGKAFDLGSYSLEVPVVVWNEGGSRSVTVARTRGDAYSYERQRGLVIIEGVNLSEPRVLSASHFRTVDVSWISEKLIHIRVGVSRLAAAEAIYDVVEGAWIYQESLQYVEERGSER